MTVLIFKKFTPKYTVTFVNKRLKVDLSLAPEVVNKNMPTILQGHYIQGTIASLEDQGYIVDLGKGKTSRGFLPNLEDGTELPLGKSLLLYIKEVLLEGRQGTG